MPQHLAQVFCSPQRCVPKVRISSLQSGSGAGCADLCLIITFFADVGVVDLDINTENRYIALKLTMSTKYKFTDTATTYFATSTVVDWIDLPAGRQVYLREKITKQYCRIVSGIASKTRVCRFTPGY